jgi:hypothetical protein
MVDHVALQDTKHAEALTELKMHMNEAKPIAYGLRGSTSWKASITPEWSLQRVLEHAMTPKTGLTAGPGLRVAGIKETLDEVSVCMCACVCKGGL